MKGETESSRKIHLLAWDKVRAPTNEGGLGIRAMCDANKATLVRLGWRLLTRPNDLWLRVIRGKHCRGRVDVDMFRTWPVSIMLLEGMIALV